MKEDVAKKFRELYGEEFLSYDTIAFGSGTTVRKIIELMPDRAKEKLSYKTIISTSRDTSYFLSQSGLVVSNVRKIPDVIVDGADSILEGFFIKGGGGALLKEKIARRLAEKVFVVATRDKIGRKFYIPTVVLPELAQVVLEEFPNAKIREGGKLPPAITDEGLALVDIPMEEPIEKIYEKLESLRPIIIEHGIFESQGKEEIITD